MDAPAIYSMHPWEAYEDAVLRTGLIRWGGQPRSITRLGRTDARQTIRFLELSRLSETSPDKARKSALTLAQHFGPLGLCGEHRLPLGHLPEESLRHVQRLLDELHTGPWDVGDPDEVDEDPPWWSLQPCSTTINSPWRADIDGDGVDDRVRPRRVRTDDGRRLTLRWQEHETDWLAWSGILSGMVAVAWQVQRSQIADYRQVRRLQPLLDIPVEVFSWQPRWDKSGLLRSYQTDRKAHPDVPLSSGAGLATGTVHVRHPDTGELVEVPAALAKGSALSAERRAAENRMLRDQRRALEAAMDRLILLTDLRARLRWKDGAARMTYGGGTLLGALVAQVALRLGGHEALAVCDLCRVTWDPSADGTWPRGGPNDGTYCPRHNNPTDRMRHRRRIRAR